MATTLNNTTIVSQSEISFMSSEIVCLKDGRHFMPAEVEIEEKNEYPSSKEFFLNTGYCGVERR